MISICCLISRLQIYDELVSKKQKSPPLNLIKQNKNVSLITQCLKKIVCLYIYAIAFWFPNYNIFIGSLCLRVNVTRFNKYLFSACFILFVRVLVLKGSKITKFKEGQDILYNFVQSRSAVTKFGREWLCTLCSLFINWLMNIRN